MTFSHWARVATFVRKSLYAMLLCLTFAMLPSTTEAAITGCRGDPIILLSNGMKIQLVIGLNIDPASVVDVTYTVHVPVGVTATSITYPVSTITLIPPSKEHVVVIADLAAKQYKTTTVATTKVAATATVTGIFTPSATATSTKLTASGANGVAIPINYTAP